MAIILLALILTRQTLVNATETDNFQDFFAFTIMQMKYLWLIDNTLKDRTERFLFFVNYSFNVEEVNDNCSMEK